MNTTCPHCGRLNDMVSPADGGAEEPSPGAVSVCFKCENFSIFDMEGDELIVRMPTMEETIQVMSMPAMMRVLGTLRGVKSK